MPQTTAYTFIPPNIRWLARPLLMVVLLYWAERVLFMFLHPALFSGAQMGDWIEFLWLSMRFDLSVIATINALFLVFLATPFSLQSLGSKVVRWLFCLLNWLFLVVNLGDAWFFTFNGRRISFDTLLFLGQDIENQATQLLFHYGYVGILGLLLGWVLWKSFSKPAPGPSHKVHPAKAIAVWLVVVAGTFGLIRNSFQVKPLLPGHAFVLSKPEMGHGILNTPFVLFKTYENEPMITPNWLEDEEVKAILAKPRSNYVGQLKGANVVILILESFATEYTGLEGNPVSYTPFLDSLAGAGLWFPNHYANGRTSKDAMPALLAGIPAWMDESFTSSQYATNSINGLGIALQKSGYRTAFYHGGKNGTMGFDIFTKMTGLRKYVGMNEYTGPKSDFDGNWGIYDEPFLQFVASDLSATPQPFAAVAFTLSSHQPYTLPPQHRNRFKKGPLAIHEAIGYADFSLRQFFRTARQMPWYSNTLFIITADHTQENADPRYSGISGNYDVPLVFYHPQKVLRADTSQYVQHLDVSASVSDLLGLGQPVPALSRSVFQTTDSYPITFANGQYQMLHHQGMLVWSAEDVAKEWAWVKKGNSTEPEGLRKKMVAQIQYFRKGMAQNKLRVVE